MGVCAGLGGSSDPLLWGQQHVAALRVQESPAALGTMRPDLVHRLLPVAPWISLSPRLPLCHSRYLSSLPPGLAGECLCMPWHRASCGVSTRVQLGRDNLYPQMFPWPVTVSSWESRDLQVFKAFGPSKPSDDPKPGPAVGRRDNFLTVGQDCQSQLANQTSSSLQPPSQPMWRPTEGLAGSDLKPEHSCPHLQLNKPSKSCWQIDN